MARAPWTPDHPLLGRVLESRFQIASFIREGGMAQVFCATQNAEPRHVAVKVMHPELAEDREIVSRFVREAHVAARLSHPNIVQIVHVGEDRELLYMVMELLFGDDLSARVKLRGSFGEERSVEIIIDVCNALDHAHGQGVIHRDIKPENIMLSRNPEAPEIEIVKVLDFGIAKVLDARPDLELPDEAPTNVRSVLTRVGTWVGTPAYMSPEQGRAEQVDHRSDLYSTGVLLYELVAGRPPFEGQTPLQIVARHVQEPPPPPSRFAPVNAELERIIMRALEKDPARRHQSAAELSDALSAVLPELGATSSARWSGRTLSVDGLEDEAPTGVAKAQEPAKAGFRAVDAVTESVSPVATAPTLSSRLAPPRRSHPLIGRILKERYQVASFVREGTMAQVFCGLSEVEPKHVAIKVVLPELANDRSIVSRFLQEGRLASRLIHPNIVRIIDVGEDDDLLFMVMELLLGDDLSARIKQRGSFNQLEAIGIVTEVCRALDHAHSQNVVHRDIKPENIMLCRQPDSPEREVTKVLDFGIAKVLDAKPEASLPKEASTSVRSVLTRVGALVGTPAYMSPEQGRAEPADHRSDLYSTGVLLYELLVGKPPFEGETPLQIIARHVQEPPRPPSELGPVSKPLEAIVLRALAKRREDRFKNAKEMIDALGAVQAELIRTTGGGAASDRWMRRTGRVVPVARSAAVAPLPPLAANRRPASPPVDVGATTAAMPSQPPPPPAAASSGVGAAPPASSVLANNPALKRALTRTQPVAYAPAGYVPPSTGPRSTTPQPISQAQPAPASTSPERQAVAPSVPPSARVAPPVAPARAVKPHEAPAAASPAPKSEQELARLSKLITLLFVMLGLALVLIVLLVAIVVFKRS
jgi:serine/threonine protein kinase